MKHKMLPLILACILLPAVSAGCTKHSVEEKTPVTDAAASEEKTSVTNEAASEEKQTGAGLQPFYAPLNFETVSLDGENVSSDIFSSSRLNMVNVWATYCNPCLNEMPGLGELALLYDPEDFQLIGIVSDVLESADEQELEQVRELINLTGASSYTHLLLSESLYEGLLTDVSAVPTTFFIDEDGKILDTVIGAMEKEDWKEKIDEFLEEM